MKSSRAGLFPEQDLAAFKHRRNMVESTSETWRPQLFAATTSRLSLFLAAVRRFFDIQAGSGWRDLSAVLPSLQGTVLDVGCGAQPFRSLVNSQATYLGIDTDAAKAHFGYEMPNTTYFSGDVWPVGRLFSERGPVHRDAGARVGYTPLSERSCALFGARWDTAVDCSLCCPMAFHSL